MVTFVHFVDPRRIGTELRPICGAWSDDITWTTVPQAMTCPACARLIRVPHPECHPVTRGARATRDGRQA